MRYGNRKRVNSHRRTLRNRSGRRLFLESLESRALLAGIHDVVETADHLHHDASTLIAEVAQTFVAEGEHTAESAGEHIHARLTIFVDRTQVVIPTNVGVGPTGFLSQIHTHDNTGELHIHPIGTEPRDRTLTLGDFFETWRTNAGVAGNNANAILSATQLFNNVSNTTDTVKMFVNGQVSDQFSDHLLHDGDNIVLVYGSDPVVSLNTNFGSIVIELFENETPGTVDNFLNYVNDGDYINSFFHRSADSGGADFVIQGGGFRTTSPTFTSTAQFSSVPTDPPIQNEPGISNVRGTVAMAKTSDPNSATSQFFVNLNDANTFLDSPSNSGGFTVFGQVLDLRSSDTIAALPIRSNPSPYGELPVSTDDQLVVIQSIEGRGEISGIHFNDTNRNGVRDSGEPAIAGATVFIDANNNGVLDPGELSTVTDANGRYLFQVDPGSYRVRVQFDSALSLTVPTAADSYLVTVEIGREEANRNFGVAEINAQPDPPLAVADTLTISNSRTPRTIDVLANDTSAPDGVQALTVTSVTQGTSGGTVTLANGVVSYLAPEGFIGTDTFTYTIHDTDGLSSSATVTINVTEVANNSVSGFVFIDADGDGLRGTGEVGVPGAQITLTGSGITRTILTDTNGAYSFTELPAGTYQLVERQPVAMLDGTDSTTVPNAIVGNDQITTIVLDGGQNLAENNFGEMGIRSQYLSIVWFFASSDSPEVMFRETIARGEELDGNRALAATIRAGGTEVPEVSNSAPIASGDQFTVNGNSVLTVAAASGVLSNDTDVDGDTLTATLLTQPTHGTLSFNVNGSFTYTPTSGFFGTDTFTYRANDGIASSNTATVTITVNPLSPAPITAADSYTLEEDSSLTVNAANGVLANDSDPEGATLTAVLVEGPAHGTLSLNANGSFTYTPVANFNATDSFTYAASDGTRTSGATTVTLFVQGVEDVPVGVNDSYSVNQGGILNVSAANGVLANDSDADADLLTAVLITEPANGTLTLNANGSFVYEPSGAFSGTDTFTYQASDAFFVSNTATVTITVVPHSDAPVAVNDGFTTMVDQTLVINAAAGVLANDSDPNGDSLTVALQSSPANGTIALSGDGAFTYTPNTGFTGTDSFTYTASDGSLTSNTATVTITVATLDLVRIRLEAADNSGTPINTLSVGQNFVVNAYVEDLRQTPQGVFAAYLDVIYNADLASVNGPIVYSADFSNGRSGSITTPGLIDEVGAFTQATLGGGEALLFSVPFVANSVGTLNLVAEPADIFPAHDTLLRGINAAIPISQLDFISDSITITAASGEGEGSGVSEYAAHADEAFAHEDDWLHS